MKSTNGIDKTLNIKCLDNHLIVERIVEAQYKDEHRALDFNYNLTTKEMNFVVLTRRKNYFKSVSVKTIEEAVREYNLDKIKGG